MDGMSGLGKTPWVDRTLKLAWDRLEDVAPGGEEGMPLPFDDMKRAFVAQEHGCGHYGCVMPTAVDGLVLKLTSDPTEAYLVAAMLQLVRRDEDWTGIVRYDAIYKVRNAFYRRRPIYAIWREEAFDVGFLTQVSALRRDADRTSKHYYDTQALLELKKNLSDFGFFATKVREKLKRSKDPYGMVEESARFEQWAWNHTMAHHHELRRGRLPDIPGGEQGLALALSYCQAIVHEMENTYHNDTVGSALSFFFEHGLLLADVHQNNVGKVSRDWGAIHGDQIVITDPGHAIPLIPRWDEVPIEEI
jgi:hypothetical protein